MFKYIKINNKTYGFELDNFNTMDELKKFVKDEFNLAAPFVFISRDDKKIINTIEDIKMDKTSYLQQLPLSTLTLNSPENNDNVQSSAGNIDLTNHFRIWFSNDPSCFLPLTQKKIIENSITNNPNIKTTLIVDRKALNEATVNDLDEWSKNNNCTILDINEIETISNIDSLILSAAKNELENWRSTNKGGNPAIASDLIRLLVADKGVYLDCDILTYANLPTHLNTPFGAFTNFLYFTLEVLNNDVMCFASENGKKILEKYKEFVVKNYFFSNNSNTEIDLSSFKVSKDELLKIISARSVKLKNIRDTEQKRSTLSSIVTELAGPFAFSDF